ncbi:MAG: hypothetical protein JW966_05970 [Anaerolineae bacterium]|nr:hypothetical protein [Anaerolineae bacterium]
MQVQQVITGQVPDWARPDNPVLRYTLQRYDRRITWVMRWSGRLVGMAAFGMLLAISYARYEAGSPLGVSRDIGSAVFAILYFPLLALQYVAVLTALVWTSNTVILEQRRAGWELVKVTSRGAAMSTRSWWVALFYRMRWMLAAIVLARVFFAGWMLVDLTRYQGRYLDLYITGITPAVSVEAAIVLLAMYVTAALLLPVVLVGLNAALGLFLSSFVNNRLLAPLLRVMIVLFETGVFGTALLINDLDVRLSWYTADARSFGDHVFAVLAGDFGLELMDLETLFRTWADTEYGVLLGAAALAAVIGMIVLTNALIMAAGWRAGRPGRG